MYAMTYYFSMFTPYMVLNWFLMKSTEAYTMAFSNTPGMLKPIEFEGRKSKLMSYYFTPTGHTGIGMSCLSYVDYFKITLTSDDTIMSDPEVLLGLVEKNIK